MLSTSAIILSFLFQTRQGGILISRLPYSLNLTLDYHDGFISSQCDLDSFGKGGVGARTPAPPDAGSYLRMYLV